MKAVILAGGLGTRISEETSLRPKPMIEIGGKPILWHIMKMYSHHGVNDFIICAGYRGFMIKEFFANYFVQASDITFDIENNSLKTHHKNIEPWKVTVIDTGEATLTGGRLKRVAKYLNKDEDFHFTYGDGLSDVDIGKLAQFHRDHGLNATLTSVFPPGRFGAVEVDSDMSVRSFNEKPRGDGGRINGGFFVLSPKVIDLIDGDDTTWESEPIDTLVKARQLKAFQHNSFWHPMDTLRDKLFLQELWDSGKAPWRTWI